MKAQAILFKLVTGIIAIVVSFLICYYFLDDLVVYYINSVVGFLALRLFIALFFFIILNWLFNKKINKLFKDILFIGYLIIIISASLLRTSHISWDNNINFNIMKISNMSLEQLIGNIIFYIPIGIYIRWRFRCKKVYLILLFIAYILVIEFLQYILKSGVFDIADITLNVLGFWLGLLLSNLITKGLDK